MEYQVIIEKGNPRAEFFSTLEEAQRCQADNENSRIFKRSEENPELYEELIQNDEKSV